MLNTIQHFFVLGMKVANPTGRLGEDMAVSFLERKGYTIIDRNFRKGYGEIDIIALQGKTVVFIEVKTRTSAVYGTPLEAVTPWKLRDIMRTALFYKQLHPKLPDQLRIDAIGVSLHGTSKRSTIEHVENITL